MTAFDEAWRLVKVDEEEYDAEKNLEALRAWVEANRSANPPEDPCEACRNLPDDHPDWMKGMCEDCYDTWAASMNLRQAPMWQHPPPTDEQRQHGDELGHECAYCFCRFDNEKSPFTWDVHNPEATQKCESDRGHRCKYCDFRTGEVPFQDQEWQGGNA